MNVRSSLRLCSRFHASTFRLATYDHESWPRIGSDAESSWQILNRKELLRARNSVLRISMMLASLALFHPPAPTPFCPPPPSRARPPLKVCNALRNDLSHPNEYVRGCTLRFLCKLREPELLEPLVPTVKVRASISASLMLLQASCLVGACCTRQSVLWYGDRSGLKHFFIF